MNKQSMVKEKLSLQQNRVRAGNIGDFVVLG